MSARRLPKTLGHLSKRQVVNSCTPCLTLKQELVCNDLCCRHYLVLLAQEDLDDGLEVQAPFVDVLKRAPTGECAYYELDTGRCLAWEKRPMVCRVYDCRDDARSPPLRPQVNRERVAFMPERSPLETCPGCGMGLELMYGAAAACDGLCPCVHCGEGFRASFRYAETSFTLTWAGPLHPSVRLRNLVEVLLRGERYSEALEALGRWRQTLAAPHPADHLRAVVLVELGRIAEARTALEAVKAHVPEAWLDLAWLELKVGRVAEARAVLKVMPPPPLPLEIRAALLRGKVAQAAGDVALTAAWFVEALARSRELGARNDELKQYVSALRATSKRASRAVDQAVLARLRRRQLT